MGCCSCFGFIKSKRRPRPIARNFNLSQELLLDDDDDNEEEEEEIEDHYNREFDGEITENGYGEDYDGECPNRVKRSEEILKFKEENGMICRQFPVRETNKLVRSEDENGNKMVNEYVREYKIGAGSYGKVVLYRSSTDGKQYAIKAFHKSHLIRQRVSSSETAMSDVLREVRIMKMVEHPNIVNLFEVIDDPNTDHFYMVLEYVDGKWACEGSGPPGGIEEATARKYLRDVVSGLIYLHNHNIVHGDIKPDNLLVTRTGTMKIGDFSVSQVFEDDNDELRRSPGTPVFTAPECCLGLNYGGKAADTWALGVTLYCMILGKCPFRGETLQETYDKIVNDPVVLPNGLNVELTNLFEGLLCKDPHQRLTLDAVAKHAWVIGDDGPIPQYSCWCQRNKLSSGQCNGGYNSTNVISNKPDDSQTNAHLPPTD